MARKSSKRSLNLIDSWSVPHFLLGTLIAMVTVVFGFPPLPLFFVTLTVAVLWEFFEMHVGIRETRMNVVSDLLMPLLAYVVTLWLLGAPGMTHEHQVALLTVTIIFYSLTSYAAWQARFSEDPDFLG